MIEKCTTIQLSIYKLLQITIACSVLYAGQVAAVNKGAGGVVNKESRIASQLIVKFRNSESISTQSLLANKVSRLSRSLAVDMTALRQTGGGAQVVQVANVTTLAQLKSIAAKMALDPNIEYAEPDLILQAMVTPNDTRYNEQWHYFDAIGGANLPSAWDISTGVGVVVAVIDTGYRPHADLLPNILPGYDMISSTMVSNDGDGRDPDATDPGDFCNRTPSTWHGTHVTGTLAAVTNNAMGVAGVANNAKVVPVRVLGTCGGMLSDIADAIIWAAGYNLIGLPVNPNPAQVINLSLGGLGNCGFTMQNAIDLAVNAGVTVVAAAGNATSDAGGFVPANCNGVVTVAATDSGGGAAWYSNTGAVVDVAAPGGDITNSVADGVLSTSNSGLAFPDLDDYAFDEGTSMATPHVAGISALLYSLNPTITPAEVKNILTSTARPFPANCIDCGAGIVDALAAVQTIAGVVPPPPPPTGQAFENINDVIIEGKETNTSVIKVDSKFEVSVIDVSIDIKHSEVGDLVIDLVSPDGTVFNLKNATTETGIDYLATHTIEASAMESQGSWKLEVFDVDKSNTGYIDQWSINFL